MIKYEIGDLWWLFSFILLIILGFGNLRLAYIAGVIMALVNIFVIGLLRDDVYKLTKG